MNIEQVKIEKRRLGGRIYKAIEEFEERSGCVVESVILDRSRVRVINGRNGKRLNFVELRITI